MEIVVIGGTGRVGSRLVELLRAGGHEPLAAAPSSGVNAITGEGVADALSGAAVVVDVSNSPSFDDAAAVLEFFSTSTRNLLEAEEAAGVGHHVAMSVVGADRLPDSGYLRAKVAEEALIAGSSIPYSIVRATQFFEFIDGIAAAATDGDTVRVSPMLIQPMAVDDVVRAVGDVVVADAPQRDDRDRGAGHVPARRARPPCSQRPSRPAPGRRRSPRPLLRRGAGRAEPRRRSRRSARRHPLRRLARPVPGHDVVGRRAPPRPGGARRPCSPRRRSP